MSVSPTLPFWVALLLLSACESPQNDASVAQMRRADPQTRSQPADSLPAFKGIDPLLYAVADAKKMFGCYLLVPDADPEFSYFMIVFYQAHPDSAWQKIEGFRLESSGVEPALDTVNIDQKGRAELLVRSYYASYGTGGGTSCSTLSIFCCENVVTKVLEVPVLYADETFSTLRGGRADYKSIRQSVQPQRGRIRVGQIKRHNLECGPSDCEGCVPKLTPGIYQLVGDTVVKRAY
jgi:hypothetical protein